MLTANLSANYNATVLVLDPYTGATRTIEFPGISHTNDTLHVAGVEYHAPTHSMFFTVDGPLPWYSLGADLSGDDYLIRYDLSTESVVWTADLNPVKDDLLAKTGLRSSGFQDSAVDVWGNNYLTIAYGNAIAKVDLDGNVGTYSFTPEETLSTAAGYLGIVAPIGSGKVIVSDALSAGFVSFDLRNNLTTGSPVAVTLTNPEAVPANFSLDCDGLIAPKAYSNTVLLCSNNFFGTLGVVTVWRTEDEFDSVTYLGLVDNQEVAGEFAAGSVPVTSFEMPGSVYFLEQFFFDGGVPSIVGNRTTFPLVDVTSRVANIVNSSKL